MKLGYYASNTNDEQYRVSGCICEQPHSERTSTTHVFKPSHPSWGKPWCVVCQHDEACCKTHTEQES
jgi:hypothetical protein